MVRVEMRLLGGSAVRREVGLKWDIQSENCGGRRKAENIGGVVALMKVRTIYKLSHDVVAYGPSHNPDSATVPTQVS